MSERRLRCFVHYQRFRLNFGIQIANRNTGTTSSMILYWQYLLNDYSLLQENNPWWSTKKSTVWYVPRSSYRWFSVSPDATRTGHQQVVCKNNEKEHSVVHGVTQSLLRDAIIKTKIKRIDTAKDKGPVSAREYDVVRAFVNSTTHIAITRGNAD